MVLDHHCLPGMFGHQLFSFAPWVSFDQELSLASSTAVVFREQHLLARVSCLRPLFWHIAWDKL